MYIAII